MPRGNAGRPRRVANWLGRRRRRRRLVALIPFRDEMGYLPAFFENVSPHVDGIVALDDGSSDGSGAYAARQPKTLEVVRAEPGANAEMMDSVLRETLIRAAWNHPCDWLLGIDADERLEANFRDRAERELDRAEEAGADALWVQFKELWTPTSFRIDGIWGKKNKACLFRSSRAHRFDDRRVHSFWASIPQPEGGWPMADLRIYHLRMLTPDDRRARMERYQRIDPDRVWQPLGYDYLVDEAGIDLCEIEPDRLYQPIAQVPSASSQAPRQST